MKKILVLFASPRKNGNSAILGQAFCKGAEENGNYVTKYHLADKNIGDCLACDYCQHNCGKCIQQDDMAELVELLQSHDTLVIASPVYYLGFPGKIKTMIDRTYAESAIGRKIKNTVLLTAACKAEPEITEVMVDYFKKLCDYLSWNKLGIVSALGVNTAGEVLEMKCVNEAYELGNQIK
ncbi:MAG: flavodoxin family protein [Bacillota bacterium]